MREGVPVPDRASDAPGPALLRLRDAEVRRDGRTILAVDELEIREGERIALIGPNGAGKSTFVGLLTREALPLWREEPPILWRGEPRPLLTDVRAVVGAVSSSVTAMIDPALTVDDVVLAGRFGALRIPQHRRPSAADRDAASRALADVGAAHLADRTFGTLSTGEGRRVMIAHALVRDPDIVVFDEPCAGLDVEAAYHVRQALSQLARAGRTVLIVTHHVEDIVPEVERVIALADARIVADGPSRDVLTTGLMHDLFGVPVTLEERDGSYRLW